MPGAIPDGLARVSPLVVVVGTPERFPAADDAAVAASLSTRTEPPADDDDE